MTPSAMTQPFTSSSTASTRPRPKTRSSTPSSDSSVVHYRGGGGGETAHDMLRWKAATGEKGPWRETASAAAEIKPFAGFTQRRPECQHA